MSRVLTFDLGSTYFKICLFDQALRLVARKRIRVPLVHPAPGRAELAVPAFRDCLTAGVHDISRQAGGLRNVERVSFASQANSFTLFDGNGRVLIPFLIWTDERARDMSVSLLALTGQSDYYATTGVALLNHYFMIAKLRWLHEYEPAIVAHTRRLCGMADYLVLWLTGNHLAEAGLMGLTGLVNIHRLQYWSDAVRFADVPIEWLPQIVRAGSDAGRIRAEIARIWGLPIDCRLALGCLDQYAGAIGAGNTEPGRVSETTGTVLATVRCAGKFSPRAAPGVFQGPAFAQGLFYQMVFSDLSGALLEKYRSQLPDRPSFEELDELAARVPAGADGLRLHFEASRRDGPLMFDGRTESHHRGHEVRAIMEAVAVELSRQVSTLCGRDAPTLIRAAGGGARSKLWLQIKSQVVGCPVQAVNSPEPTSLGAARLAHLEKCA